METNVVASAISSSLATGKAAASRRPSSGVKCLSWVPQTRRTGPAKWPSQVAASVSSVCWMARANRVTSCRMAALSSSGWIQRVAVAVMGLDPADTVGLLLAGADAWLDASTEPDLQRIVLLDGPSVLGWEKWREICLRHTVGLIAALLQDGIDRGSLAPQPVQALTHVLVGAVDEAALYIAQADDALGARADMDLVLRRLTLGLAAPA